MEVLRNATLRIVGATTCECDTVQVFKWQLTFVTLWCQVVNRQQLPLAVPGIALVFCHPAEMMLQQQHNSLLVSFDHLGTVSVHFFFKVLRSGRVPHEPSGPASALRLVRTAVCPR